MTDIFVDVDLTVRRYGRGERRDAGHSRLDPNIKLPKRVFPLAEKTNRAIFRRFSLPDFSIDFSQGIRLLLHSIVSR